MIENSKSQKLFGDLPEYPPWYDEASYCSECSECEKDIAQKNNENTNQGKKNINKDLFILDKNHKKVTKGTKHKRICMMNQGEHLDMNTQIMKAIRQGRKKASRCGEHYEYIDFKDPASDELVARRVREYHYKLDPKKEQASQKFNKILESKSHKKYVENLKKKCVSLNHKGQQLHNIHKLQQQSAYMLLREERAQYLKKLHNVLFELEKDKLITDKKHFKESLHKNAFRSKKQIQAMETRHANTVTELRQMLEEAKKQTHVNKISQKSVLRDLEKQLKAEQQKVNQKMQSKVANEIERAQVQNYDKYGQKLDAMRR